MALPLLGALEGISKAGLSVGGIQALGIAANSSARSMAALPSRLNAFADSLLAGKDAMREYSGIINQSFAKLDIAERLGSKMKANYLAPGISQQVDQTIAFKKVLAPFEAIITREATKVSTAVVVVLKEAITLIEAVPGIGDELKRVREEMEKAGQQPLQSVQFLNDIADGKLSGRMTDRIDGPARQPPRENSKTVDVPYWQGFARGFGSSLGLPIAPPR